MNEGDLEQHAKEAYLKVAQRPANVNKSERVVHTLKISLHEFDVEVNQCARMAGDADIATVIELAENIEYQKERVKRWKRKHRAYAIMDEMIALKRSEI